MFAFHGFKGFFVKLMVVLLEPEYEENIGLIARAMKNFGVSKLVLVNPKADFKSPKAKSRAMHATELLSNAVIVNSLREAISKADFSAATTAVCTANNKMFRNALTPKELVENFASTNAVLALVFGRESTGLRNSEIKECDFVVTIPSSKKYKTLNVSHAVAVLLWEFFSHYSKPKIKIADKETKQALLCAFEKMVGSSSKIRNRAAVLDAFNVLLSRAPITKKEASAITGVFAETVKKIKK